jgi:hypothetical protein
MLLLVVLLISLIILVLNLRSSSHRWPIAEVDVDAILILFLLVFDCTVFVHVAVAAIWCGMRWDVGNDGREKGGGSVGRGRESRGFWGVVVVVASQVVQ